jgi:hypothetical protein
MYICFCVVESADVAGTRMYRSAKGVIGGVGSAVRAGGIMTADAVIDLL